MCAINASCTTQGLKLESNECLDATIEHHERLEELTWPLSPARAKMVNLLFIWSGQISGVATHFSVRTASVVP